MRPKHVFVTGDTNVQIMNKAFRQGQILKLIRTKRILTQDDLARELKESQGIDTSQVTLSRDVRELGLLKTHDGYRQVSGTASGPDLATVIGEFLQDVRAAQNLVLTSKARALMQNRVSVSYEDVQSMARPILRHRILLNFQAESDKLTQDDILKQLLEAVPQPRG